MGLFILLLGYLLFCHSPALAGRKRGNLPLLMANNKAQYTVHFFAFLSKRCKNKTENWFYQVFE